MRTRRIIELAALFAVGAGLSCAGGGEPPGAGKVAARAHPGVTEAEPRAVEKAAFKQTVYVPAYSYAYTDDGARPFNLAATLYVRNTERAAPILIHSVKYYDGAGKLLREMMKAPLRVDPLASMEYFVKQSDVSGGSAASFLVVWSAETEVSPPVVETLMVGTMMNQGIALISPGRVVQQSK